MLRAKNDFAIEGIIEVLVNEPQREMEFSPSIRNLLNVQTELAHTSLKKLPSSGVTVYLLDIEGATTPQPFLNEYLPEVVATHMEKVMSRWYPDEVKIRDLVNRAAKVCPEVKEALEIDPAAVCPAFTRHILKLTADNCSSSYIQDFRTWVLEDCYKDGVVQGHIFDDAAAAIKKWGARGQWGSKVAIFSTMSTGLQELHFRHSNHGDLSPYISFYFDSSTYGSKLDHRTYKKIGLEIENQLKSTDVNVIFLTSKSNELVASKISGAIDASFLVFRPLNEHLTLDTLSAVEPVTVTSFQQLWDGASADISLSSACVAVASYLRGEK